MNLTSVNRWQVSRWMSRELYTLKPAAPAIDAFDLMRANRIRHIPVVENHKLVGIVSDRDIRPLIHTTGGIPSQELLVRKVESIMTHRPISISPESSIQEAAEIICKEKIGALPVLDNEELLGIVTAEDLLWAFLENTRDMEFEP